MMWLKLWPQVIMANVLVTCPRRTSMTPKRESTVLLMNGQKKNLINNSPQDTYVIPYMMSKQRGIKKKRGH